MSMLIIVFVFKISIHNNDYAFKEECENFIRSLRNMESVSVQTSGSTGLPKTILLSFKTIKASALKTNRFFELDTSSRSVLCLSPKTIAGKMMLARAYFGEYQVHCINPNSNPFEDLTDVFDFIAIVPLQLQASLDDILKLEGCPKILVGGVIYSTGHHRSIDLGRENHISFVWNDRNSESRRY